MPGPLEYFRRLGVVVDERWTAVDCRVEHLAGLAAEALEEVPPPDDLTPEALLGELVANTSLPEQGPAADNFGQPPAVVYRNGDLLIQAITWMDGATSIHEHGFDGAFRVLRGSSLHVGYGFIEEHALADGHLVTGRLVMGEPEILHTGAVRPIVSGPEFIHALFHLERPSVTVVVRNRSSHLARPQYNYRLPGLGIDPSDADEGLGIRLRGLHSLHHLDPDRAVEAAVAVVGGRDLWTAFQVCDDWAHTFGEGPELSALVGELDHQDPGLGALLNPMYADVARRTRLLTRRGMLAERDHRLFLALLILLPDWRSIEFSLGQAFPEEDPDRLVLRWVEELASPEYRGASGLHLGSDGMDLLRAHLRPGETPAEPGAVASQWRPPVLLEPLFA